MRLKGLYFKFQHQCWDAKVKMVGGQSQDSFKWSPWGSQLCSFMNVDRCLCLWAHIPVIFVTSVWVCVNPFYIKILVSLHGVILMAWYLGVHIYWTPPLTSPFTNMLGYLLVIFMFILNVGDEGFCWGLACTHLRDITLWVFGHNMFSFPRNDSNKFYELKPQVAKPWVDFNLNLEWMSFFFKD